MRARFKNFKNFKFKVLKRLAVVIKRLITIGVYIVNYLFPVYFKAMTNSALK